jgi:hypothetical protein
LTPPQQGQPCQLTPCSLPCGTTVCEACGVDYGYLTKSGSAIGGWCVCAASATGNQWSCGDIYLWPRQGA